MRRFWVFGFWIFGQNLAFQLLFVDVVVVVDMYVRDVGFSIVARTTISGVDRVN